MLTLRPAQFCRQLLAALGASEGRRQQRKRDTTPDAIGLALKRDLLAEAIREDPEPGAFEGWLLQRCLAAGNTSGPLRAIAQEVLAEWRLAEVSPAFQEWLKQGAPSDDAKQEG